MPSPPGHLTREQTRAFDRRAIDEFGIKIVYGYDAEGNKTSETLYNAGNQFVSAKSWLYNAEGQLILAVDDLGIQTVYGRPFRGHARAVRRLNGG